MNSIQRRLSGLLTAAAVTMTAAGCGPVGSSTGTAGGAGGGAGGQGTPPAGLNGKSAPAPANGYCVVGPHTIANLSGLVTGTLEWTCTGPVLMTLTVRLIFVGNNTEHETEVDEGSPISVDNVTGTSPARLTAPCTDGLWKMKIVGAVTEPGSATLTLNTSDKANPPFNDPEWQSPTPITC